MAAGGPYLVAFIPADSTSTLPRNAMDGIQVNGSRAAPNIITAANNCFNDVIPVSVARTSSSRPASTPHSRSLSSYNRPADINVAHRASKALRVSALRPLPLRLRARSTWGIADLAEATDSTQNTHIGAARNG